MFTKFLSALWLSVALVSLASAAPPTLPPFYPAGVQRGSSAEVTASGEKFWTSSASLIVEPAKDKGKFTIKASADATPGTYWLRAVNDDGASNLRPFIVGTLPEVQEKEPNDDPKSAQPLADGCTVNGKLSKSGETDCFAIVAKKGQTLVASVEAHRTLRSPMDSVVQIVSPDGFVLDENHDFHGLDPQVMYTVPKDGTYIVRIFAFPSQPDTSIRFSGADSYIYRLTITIGGILDFAMPLSGGPDAKFEPRGWNIPVEVKTLTFKDGAVFHPRLAGVFRPKPDPKASSHLIDKPGGEIAVPFAAKKGQVFAVEASSRSLGLPVDPVIRVLDKEKKTLVRAEPPRLHSDTALTFTAPADSEFTAVVSDLYAASGPRHAFALRIAPPEPGFELSVASDRFTIPPGKSLDVPVKITRKNGFTKPIEVAAESLPEGMKFEIKPPAGKEDPNLIVVTLSSAKATPGGAFRLVGKVKDEPALTRSAKAPLAEYDDTTEFLWVSSTDSAATPEPKKKKR